MTPSTSDGRMGILRYAVCAYVRFFFFFLGGGGGAIINTMTYYKTIPQKAKLIDPVHPGRLGRGPLDPHGGIALPQRDGKSLEMVAGRRHRWCPRALAYTVRTDKFSIEHTSVGLAHARPIILMNPIL